MNAAGFNRLSKSAHLNETVGTAGLGNCIAVVGFNRTLDTMAIAHYDTFNCLADDDAEKNETALKNFRKWLIGNTKASQFKVGLGTIWYNTANSSSEKNEQGYPSTDATRFELIRMVKRVFDYEPIYCGSSFTFTAPEGVSHFTSYAGDQAMSNGWATEGIEIPYREFEA